MNGQSLVKGFVPLPGGATAVYSSSGLDHYRHPDWLGSARVTSSASRVFLSSVAYAPFGETYANSGTLDLSFTGQNQDTVSGDYDFLFREYSTQGRWVSPDPAGLAAVSLAVPQSWNRYSYVLNNPLSLLDPLGLIQACTTVQGPGDSGPVTMCVDYGDDPTASSSWDSGGGGGGGGYTLPCTGFVSGGCLIPPPPLPPIQVLNLVPSKPCRQTAGQRIVTGVVGATNLAEAGLKTAGLATLDTLATVAAPETGGLSLLAASAITTYGVTSISGQTVTGMGQLYSAFTGDAEGGERVSHAGDILSGPIMGIGTLVATGDKDLAQRNASAEGFATGVIGARQAKGLRERIASSIDAGLSALGYGGEGCHP
jgi:RHS repeat-associated protein